MCRRKRRLTLSSGREWSILNFSCVSDGPNIRVRRPVLHDHIEVVVGYQTNTLITNQVERYATTPNLFLSPCISVIELIRGLGANPVLQTKRPKGTVDTIE